VLLLEEQNVMRQFLSEMIGAMPGFTLLGSTGDCQTAEQLCSQHRPDLAIVDVLVGDNSQAGIVATLKRVSPQTNVLVFSATTEADWVRDAVASGASGFIDKSIDLTTLRRAIVEVSQHRQFFSQRIHAVLNDLLRRRARLGAESLLTHRERQILREIALGKISKEVAAAYGLSVFSVENIRRKIMRKTGLRSIAALTLRAVKLGLIQGTDTSTPSAPPPPALPRHETNGVGAGAKI
jgi:DNA-binding NarL/FixJ family response regulator